VLAAAGARAGDTIGIEFADGRIGARVTDAAPREKSAARPTPSRKREGGGGPGGQGSLL
jgi:exodeoxyribonuclease VII large subunit